MVPRTKFNGQSLCTRDERCKRFVILSSIFSRTAVAPVSHDDTGGW